ncbi:MAG: cytochrome c3 family protein [Bdellovibrionales bacterium]
MRFVLVTLITALLIAFNSCDGIRTPTAARSMSSVGFDHTGITSNCNSCHAPGRTFNSFPASGHQDIGTQDCSSCHTPTTWFSNVNPHGPGKPVPTDCLKCHVAKRPTDFTGMASLVSNSPVGGLFDHTGFGMGDCVTCHTSVPQNIGVEWKGGVFSHSPVPSTCIGCHPAGGPSNQLPSGPVGASKYDHAMGESGDCAKCHLQNPANVGRTWAQAAFNHSPTPTSCASCHANGAAYLAIAGQIMNQMRHVITGLPDCARCHSARSQASNWASWVAETGYPNGSNAARASLGVFHTNFGSTLNTCSTCHTNERPIGPSGASGYNHATGGGMNDCVGCHSATASNIGKTWAGAKTSDHTLQANCTTCHATGAQYVAIRNVPYNQMVHTFTGLGDCNSCHAPQASASNWTSWVAESGYTAGSNGDRAQLGIFHSKYGSTPVSCATCHTAERPSGAVGASGFNHTTGGGTGDCATCHTRVAANIGKSWKGATVDHSGYTTCLSCHSGDVPNGYVPNTTSGFNHAAQYGTECASCHTVVKANVGVTWAKGYFDHVKAFPDISTNQNINCSTCHNRRFEHHSTQNCYACHDTRSPRTTLPTSNANGNYGGSFSN